LTFMRTPITKRDLRAQEAEAPAPVQAVAGAPAAPTAEKTDQQSVAEQIVKFIPAEVIAFYLPALAAVAGLKPTDGSISTLYTNTLWIVFVAGIIATLAYMYRSAYNDLAKQKIPNPKMRSLAKAVISTFAFGIWALYLGGPFAATNSTSTTVNASGQALYTIFGTLLILGFTLANPFIYDSIPFPNSSDDLSIVTIEHKKTTKPNDLGQVNSVTLRNHTSEDIRITKISLYWRKNDFEKALAASKKISIIIPANSELKIAENLAFMDYDSKIHYLELETADGIILKSQPIDSTK
jgi:hypothetical protein